MAREILKSFLFSLEWRVYAFIITTLYLWITTGYLAFAALQALGLQVLLLIGHTLWYYFRTRKLSAHDE